MPVGDGGRLTQVTVVDCDVHQGDGTAAIFADDPSVRTISFHCEDNFPYNKQVRLSEQLKKYLPNLPVRLCS